MYTAKYHCTFTPVLVGALLLGGLATVTLAEPPPLIPRDVLFGNPDKAAPKISPDGKRLAYLAPDEGVLNIWVRTLGQRDDRPLTRDRNRGIQAWFWAPNNEQILYIRDRDGDENWHLYAVDVETRNDRNLTPIEGIQARIVAVAPNFPDEILIAANSRDPQLHDVYRLNIRSGDRRLIAENDQGFVAWQADHDYRVRSALKFSESGGSQLLVRDDVDSEWRTLTGWAPLDALTSGPVTFTPDNKGLYIISSAGSNASELRVLELSSGTERTLASDPRYDVSDLLIHPINHQIQAVAFTRERMEWSVIDPDIEADVAAIRMIRRGDFKVINRDHDDNTWLIGFTSDDGPVAYYTYDRESKKHEFLFTNRKALENIRLARMEPIRFEARDGLTIHGYLTLPPGVEPRNLPMVLNVHGGPWYRDTWGFDNEVQWLANRGYAVLQVNFRGSTGYGKDFVNAGNREWGGKMQDDLLDGVNWVVRRGIADPKRVAIFGASYGGYATLVGLTFTPDVFASGVAMVGPSNLITFMQTTPPYWKPIESVLWDRVGHPEKDADFLKSRSPLFHVDRITRPLLIAQGANDPRVKRSESLQIVEAMKKAGKEVEYVEYPDEGHGFARPENRLDFYARAERFLAAHIGGRYEP